MEAADSIAVALDAALPVPLVLEDDDHETLVEISEAYYELADDLREDMDRALAGQMKPIQVVALAARLVWRVEPDRLAMVIARLISTSEERPVDSRLAITEVDIDLSQPFAPLLPQDC